MFCKLSSYILLFCYPHRFLLIHFFIKGISFIYKQNILHIVRQKHIFSFICLNVYKSIWILNFLWKLIYLLYVASILRIASLHDDEQSFHLVIGHWWIPTSSTTEYKQSSSNVYIIMFLLDYEGTKDNWIVQAD